MTLDWKNIAKRYQYLLEGKNEKEINNLKSNETDFHKYLENKISDFELKVNKLYEELEELENDPSHVKVVKKHYNIHVIGPDEQERTEFLNEIKEGKILNQYYDEYIYKNTTAYTETQTYIQPFNDIVIYDIESHYHDILDVNDFYSRLFRKEFLDNSFKKIYDKYLCVKHMNLEYDELTEQERDVDYFRFRCS